MSNIKNSSAARTASVSIAEPNSDREKDIFFKLYVYWFRLIIQNGHWRSKWKWISHILVDCNYKAAGKADNDFLGFICIISFFSGKMSHLKSLSSTSPSTSLVGAVAKSDTERGMFSKIYFQWIRINVLNTSLTKKINIWHSGTF